MICACCPPPPPPPSSLLPFLPPSLQQEKSHNSTTYSGAVIITSLAHRWDGDHNYINICSPPPPPPFSPLLHNYPRKLYYSGAVITTILAHRCNRAMIMCMRPSLPPSLQPFPKKKPQLHNFIILGQLLSLALPTDGTIYPPSLPHPPTHPPYPMSDLFLLDLVMHTAATTLITSRADMKANSVSRKATRFGTDTGHFSTEHFSTALLSVLQRGWVA